MPGATQPRHQAAHNLSAHATGQQSRAAGQHHRATRTEQVTKQQDFPGVSQSPLRRLAPKAPEIQASNSAPPTPGLQVAIPDTRLHGQSGSSAAAPVVVPRSQTSNSAAKAAGMQVVMPDAKSGSSAAARVGVNRPHTTNSTSYTAGLQVATLDRGLQGQSSSSVPAHAGSTQTHSKNSTSYTAGLQVATLDRGLQGQSSSSVPAHARSGQSHSANSSSHTAGLQVATPDTGLQGQSGSSAPAHMKFQFQRSDIRGSPAAEQAGKPGPGQHGLAASSTTAGASPVEFETASDGGHVAADEAAVSMAGECEQHQQLSGGQTKKVRRGGRASQSR